MLSPEINYNGKIKKVKSFTAKKSIFFVTVHAFFTGCFLSPLQGLKI